MIRRATLCCLWSPASTNGLQNRGANDGIGIRFVPTDVVVAKQKSQVHKSQRRQCLAIGHGPYYLARDFALANNDSAGGHRGHISGAWGF